MFNRSSSGIDLEATCRRISFGLIHRYCPIFGRATYLQKVACPFFQIEMAIMALAYSNGSDIELHSFRKLQGMGRLLFRGRRRIHYPISLPKARCAAANANYQANAMRWTPKTGPPAKLQWGWSWAHSMRTEDLPMKAKRKRQDAGFKAYVALEALMGENTIQQIATIAIR